MLYELELLETRRIAELAGDLHKVRDRLLEKIPATRLGEPLPARGQHNPLATLDLEPALTRTSQFAALRDAVTALPRDLRAKLWAIVQIGGGREPAGGFASALAETAALSDGALTSLLLGEPELQRMLTKGLYRLGAAPQPVA